MSYEIGKEYTFGPGEFVASRETGRLYFLIGENGTGRTYRVSPFEFQNRVLPDRIVCVYKENDRFEQSLSSVLADVYHIGETYEFKVFRVAQWGLTLRDETNGLTHNNIQLPGRIHIERYDKLVCRVVSFEGGKLQLEYAGTQALERDFFSPATFMSLGALAAQAWVRHGAWLLKRLPISEARDAIKMNDSGWIMLAVNALIPYIPQWLAGAPARRLPWLERMRQALMTVAESDRFVSSFSKKSGVGYKMRFALTQAILQLEYMQKAATLISGGGAEEMIDHTLQAMRESGWIYKPDERMGVLMSILSMAPRYAHDHISEIFDIIKARRLNPKFMEMFGRAFIDMLSLYIENRRTLFNAADRASLREQAEAIAIELLLSSDLLLRRGKEFELWDRHRGLLYTLSTVITGRTDTPTISMAMRSFAGINDSPLEFRWDDLDDINRLCYHLLPDSRPAPTQDKAIFEGSRVRVRISDKNIVVSPAWLEEDGRTNFRRSLGGGISFGMRLPSRPKRHAEEADTNLTHHHLLWNEIGASLREEGNATGGQLAHTSVLVGNKVKFVVCGSSPESKYEFQCRLLDENNEVIPGSPAAFLPMSETVPYPVEFSGWDQIFTLDGNLIVLEGIIDDILPDSRLRLSMRNILRDINACYARQDMESGDEIMAMITDLSGTQYKATSEYGYGLLISKREPQLTANPLELGDVVWVRINNVNHRVADGKLYINANFVRRGTTEDYDGVGDLTFGEYDCECLNSLLYEAFGKQTIEPAEVCADSQEEMTQTDEDETTYITAEALDDVAMLLEQCAALRRDNMVGCYTDLAVAQLLSEEAGDRMRTDILELKMRLQEALSRFAKDGHLDQHDAERLLADCAGLTRTSAEIASRVAIVAILAGLDRPQLLERFRQRCEETAENDETVAALLRLATAYNTLEGMGLPVVRTDLRTEMYRILSLPTARQDTDRLNVQEDLHHEFKTSLIYPANGGMLPDENRQGEEIVKAIAAFLNTEGGTLYLGVDNGGYIRGLDNDFRYLNHGSPDYDIREMQDKYNLLLQSHLRRLIGNTVDGLPLIPDYLKIEYEQSDRKWICRLVINPFPVAVQLKDSRIFIRKEGEKNEIRDAHEKRRFIERRNAKA